MHIKRSLLLGALVTVMATVGTVAGFFVGQSTRPSDTVVAARVSHAVAARGAKAARDTKRAVTHQRRHDMNVLRRTTRKLRGAYRKKMDDAFARGKTQGYSSGEATGRSQGFTSGHEAGLQDGSDALGCSDDVDVWWLPACSY